MKIVKLMVEDFKRIEAIEISPTSNAVEITGRNEQGKSSVLDAIEAALGGKRHQPEEPIRRGAERARIVLDLGDLIIERVWTEKTDRLQVKSSDGATWPRAQEKLDALFGKLTFDPLRFLDLSPTEQRQQLLRLIGVDLDAFDRERQSLYDERRDINRDLARAKSKVDEVGVPSKKSPGKEVDAKELSDRYSNALDQVAHQKSRRQDLENVQEEIADLLERLSTLEEKEAEITEEIKGFEDPGVDALRQQISEIDEVNSSIRLWNEQKSAVADMEHHQKESDRLTSAMEAIDEKKAATLQEAKMPVRGLEVTDEGLYYKGTPLSQEALSRRVRICTAISAALNPKLKIALVRDGNNLDDDILATFYKEAKAAGLEQVWVERRTGIQDHAIEIVAGTIVPSK